MDDTKKSITIYSYSKVWKPEKKIYAIQNWTLPVPIDPWQLLYFGGTWAICNVIFSLIPGFLGVPVVIRSILIPFGISKFLMTKKLDGKNPIRFFGGVVIFIFTEQGKIIEHFRSSPEKIRTVRLDWKCSQGGR